MYCCDSCCTLHICIFEPEKYLIVKGVKKMVMMMMVSMMVMTVAMMVMMVAMMVMMVAMMVMREV